MPQTPHVEEHFTASAVVRDVVIGMSDGLTVPFALAAGLSGAVAAVRSDQKRWVDFMMRFELGLEEPDPRRAAQSALTIAASYLLGGLIPLAPYFFLPSVQAGLAASVAVTLLAKLIS